MRIVVALDTDGTMHVLGLIGPQRNANVITFLGKQYRLEGGPSRYVEIT